MAEVIALNLEPLSLKASNVKLSLRSKLLFPKTLHQTEDFLPNRE